MSILSEIKDFLGGSIRSLFNSEGAAQERLSSHYVVTSAQYCRTHSFEQLEDFASLHTLLGQTSRLYMEAKQDPAHPSRWSLQTIEEDLVDGEWIVNKGDYAPAYNKSFDEVVNSMAIFEKHQSNFLGNIAIPLSEQDRNAWFSGIAKNEGYFEDIENRFSRPDQNGDLVGRFHQRELDRLQAQQNGVFQIILGNSAPQGGALERNLKMMSIVASLQEKYFDPLLQIQSKYFNLHDSSYSIREGKEILNLKDKYIKGPIYKTGKTPPRTRFSADWDSDEFDKYNFAAEDILLHKFNLLFKHIEDNPNGYLSREDQQKFRHMTALIAIEQCVQISQDLYQKNLKNPTERATAAITFFNNTIADLTQRYFKDVSPATLKQIENDIINGAKKEGPDLQSKVIAQFEDWKRTTLENVRDQKAGVQPLKIGHLANTARLTAG